eukprot:CAMPEP_0179491542 /NCGR_PEP_ID=MMETSP0799-20121207/66153_1 /TAXON_ID=46947 /ORGANISM="Geminigera cryophila, Strain CCMP2564" /LENGTH=414 /DNA_ID=CAMNT_0021308019 /DNA_START=38 /DNA_END=1284 /DNA_ORIENTATION=+
MSGLTIALMSIDAMNLSVIMSRAAAETLPIFLDRISTTRAAIFLSVTLILIFSEIIPQAVFSKHKLKMGAYLSRFVTFLTYVVWPIAYPLARLLDRVLGKDHTTVFRRAALKELTKAHLRHPESNHGGPLTQDEVRILNGTLDMADKTAVQAMRPLEDTFMLHCNAELNMGTLKNIMATGHSRTSSSALSSTHPPNPTHPPYTAILDLLNRFSKGSARLALVVAQRDVLASPEELEESMAMGIVTLEDVIEELIQEEILDESDQGVDVVAMLAHKFALEKAATDVRLSRGRSREFKKIQASMQSPSRLSPLAHRRRRSAFQPEVDDETWKPLALASLMKTRQPSQVAVCDGMTHTNALPDGAAVAVAGSSAGVHSTHIFQSALDGRAHEVATQDSDRGRKGGEEEERVNASQHV